MLIGEVDLELDDVEGIESMVDVLCNATLRVAASCDMLEGDTVDAISR